MGRGFVAAISGARAGGAGPTVGNNLGYRDKGQSRTPPRGAVEHSDLGSRGLSVGHVRQTASQTREGVDLSAKKLPADASPSA